MRSFLLSSLFLIWSTASAQQFDTRTDGTIEGGWVVAIPSGSSDYFHVRYDVCENRTVVGLPVSVADFGATQTYPRLGAFLPNLGMDPTGNTPDLAVPLAEVSSPSVLGSRLFDFVSIPTPSFAHDCHPYHVAVQFPPGDSGLLAVGADTDDMALGGGELPGGHNPFDSSGFTSDGFASPSVFPFASGEWGLNVEYRHTEMSKFGLFNGLDTESGDHVTYTVQQGEGFGTIVSAPDFPLGDEVYLMFLSFLGEPIVPLGDILPLPHKNGGSSTSRLRARFPQGLGNTTLNLVAITGTLGVSESIHITNEVTLSVLSDPTPFGCYDDGTYETGWTVSIPSESSDYFNVNFGDASASNVNRVFRQRIAVMDFGASVSIFPVAGHTPENTAVDPTGNTPDLTVPYESFPFPFPPLTFCTTSAQMVPFLFDPFAPTTPNLHGMLRFPPGDPGLLGIGGDTNSSFISGLSGWTNDAYETPANLFSANWGMCCDGNGR